MQKNDCTVGHAQLTFGRATIMLRFVLRKETQLGSLVKQPDEVGSGQTQSACVVVANADAAYTCAKVGGAKMAMQIREEACGGRSFRCVDVVGDLWSFGSFDPLLRPA